MNIHVRHRSVVARLLIACAALAALAFPAGAQTLKAVKDRGALNCGVSQGLPGFSVADDKNAWTGFDVDFCRAIAAAIFNDPAKVNFVPLDTAARFDALKVGKIGRHNAFLSVDGGRAFRLSPGDVITVRSSDKVTRLIRLKNTSFFEILNNKFIDRQRY